MLHGSCFTFIYLDMRTSLFIGCWLWLLGLTVLIQSWQTNISLQIYVKILIFGTKWLNMPNVHQWLFIPRYCPLLIILGEMNFCSFLIYVQNCFVHLKIFKTILKVVCYFTAIFQKQRNSKWRGLYSFCEKKCYCGVNSKIWIRRYSLFWRKGQTQATAYLWWWGIVFLIFLFLFSFGGGGGGGGRHFVFW